MDVKKVALVFSLLSSCLLFSQELPSNPFPNGTWDFGVWNGGGVGIYSATSGTRVLSAGFRVGKVITDLHGRGLLRGSLEYGFDVVPTYLFWLNKHDTVYGGGVNPIVLLWNLQPRRRLAPFVETAFGGIITSSDIPQGDSNFNLNAQGGLGTRIFVRPDNTTDVSVKFLHISNAHMGTHNPGFNQIYVTVSYHWLKH